MEKRTMNPFSGFVISISCLLFFCGFIQSIDLASETYSYWGETKVDFDFELFLRYFIPVLVIAITLFTLAIILELLLFIREKLETLSVMSLNKNVIRKKVSNEEGLVSKKEILKDFLDNGVITQEEYDAEISK